MKMKALIVFSLCLGVMSPSYLLASVSETSPDLILLHVVSRLLERKQAY